MAGEIMKNKIFDFTVCGILLVFVILLITMPDICKTGAVSGILLCGRVIIPSLFPFGVCVMFIINSRAVKLLEYLNPAIRRLTGFSAEVFTLVLLSFTGGYPIGAKLLSNAVKNGVLTANRAGVMLNFCINAGPAFIISAVGSGILGSKKTGVILLCANIAAGILLCFISRRFEKFETSESEKSLDALSPADNFVYSVAEAAGATVKICGFVILFSVISAYMDYYGEKYEILKILALPLEVTNAVSKSSNVYLISFLLGFGGISVWCQALAVCSNVAINYPRFILFRVLHGALSAGITAILLKLFPQALPAFSTSAPRGCFGFYSTAAVGISLFVLGLTFIISLSSRKYADKILEEIF